jgi:hypothetical protein
MPGKGPALYSEPPSEFQPLAVPQRIRRPELQFKFQRSAISQRNLPASLGLQGVK